MNKYLCGAVADIGCERENQEDFIQFKELNDDTILCVIADGTGSMKERPHPAAIVTMDIVESLTELFLEKRELFFMDTEYFIRKSMLNANKLLGAFKMGNEELYSGYAASVTCCLLTRDNRIYAGHSGNTRLYIMREGVLRQVTQDHTKASELLKEGKIDESTYYIHPDRLKMTSGLGILIDPKIQTFSGSIRANDLVLLTTDGIHYAIRPEAMAQLILEGQGCDGAARNLIEAAKTVIKYPDNMSCIVLCRDQQ